MPLFEEDPNSDFLEVKVLGDLERKDLDQDAFREIPGSFDGVFSLRKRLRTLGIMRVGRGGKEGPPDDAPGIGVDDESCELPIQLGM